jgi:hypothetical protein
MADILAKRVTAPTARCSRAGPRGEAGPDSGRGETRGPRHNCHSFRYFTNLTLKTCVVLSLNVSTA